MIYSGCDPVGKRALMSQTSIRRQKQERGQKKFFAGKEEESKICSTSDRIKVSKRGIDVFLTRKPESGGEIRCESKCSDLFKGKLPPSPPEMWGRDCILVVFNARPHPPQKIY